VKIHATSKPAAGGGLDFQSDVPDKPSRAKADVLPLPQNNLPGPASLSAKAPKRDHRSTGINPGGGVPL